MKTDEQEGEWKGKRRKRERDRKDMGRVEDSRKV